MMRFHVRLIAWLGLTKQTNISAMSSRPASIGILTSLAAEPQRSSWSPGQPPRSKRSLERAGSVPILQIVVGRHVAIQDIFTPIALGDRRARVKAGWLAELLGDGDEVWERVLGVLEQRLGRTVRLTTDLLLVMPRKPNCRLIILEHWQ